MKFSHRVLVGAALVSMMGVSVAADANDRRPQDHRNEQSYRANHHSYRSDPDRNYQGRNRDNRRGWRNADRRRSDRDGSYADMARRNYENERDLQTCYRNGRRICP